MPLNFRPKLDKILEMLVYLAHRLEKRKWSIRSSLVHNFPAKFSSVPRKSALSCASPPHPLLSALRRSPPLKTGNS